MYVLLFEREKERERERERVPSRYIVGVSIQIKVV